MSEFKCESRIFNQLGRHLKQHIVFLAVLLALALALSLRSESPPEFALAEGELLLAAEVSIFVASWCPSCKALEKFLKRYGIRYTRFDIERDMEGWRRYRKLGGTGAVPLIKVGSKKILGFRPREIIDALRTEKKPIPKSL